MFASSAELTKAFWPWGAMNSSKRRNDGTSPPSSFGLPPRSDIGSKTGHLALFDCGENGELELRQELDVVGIFDAKWHDDILAVASSSGSIDFYSWRAEAKGRNNGTMKLKTNASSMICIGDEGESNTESDMALTVCWLSSEVLLATYSSGKIVYWKIDEHGEARPLWIKSKAHQFEAWSSTFSPDGNECVLFSGGDDAKLFGWDIRAGKSPVLRSTHYKAGVTSFEHSTSAGPNSNFLYIGSYDDTVSIWDIRKFKSPIVSEIVGGGVWRIRCKTVDGQDRLALATMYDGFTILDGMKAGSVSFGSKSKYHGPHKTLAYGIDWRSLTNNEDSLLACGSFYDKTLSTSRMPKANESSK